jgi:hypothetical protein
MAEFKKASDTRNFKKRVMHAIDCDLSPARGALEPERAYFLQGSQSINGVLSKYTYSTSAQAHPRYAISSTSSQLYCHL